MLKKPACLWKLTKAASSHKLWAVFLITSTFLFLISVMVNWRLSQEDKIKNWGYRLPLEVKCPPVLPASKSGWPYPLSKDIYFVETSEQTNPNFLFMCSVESAARAHPESRIFVLMKGLANHNVTLPRNLGISLLSCFPNVEFKPLDLLALFSDTPLAGWYLLAQQRWEPYFLANLSDACRIAILWKFGGIYLDTDFIVLRNLNNLTNVLCAQSKDELNGAFLSFEPKHKFLELCIQDFVADYNRWIWGHQGPQLFSRNFQRWYSIQSCSSSSSSESCRDVAVLPQAAFYPISWQDWRKYFETVNASELLKLFKDTYAAHLWNNKSQGKKLKITPETVLGRLQSSYCPSTYALRKMLSQEK